MDKRKLFLIILAVVLVTGLFLRLFPLRSGYHYWDETVYLQHAEILTGESSDNYNEFEFRPPLFALILAGAFIVNSSLLSAHLMVAGLSSMAIILVYILGKELYSRQTGLIASAIYAVSPLGIMLSHDILVGSILPVFWLGAVFCLVKALKTDKKLYFVLTGLIAAFAVLMKFTSLAILPAIILVILLSNLKDGSIDIESIFASFKSSVNTRKNWMVAIGFFIGVLPYLAWSYIEFGSALHVFAIAWAKSGARDAFITYLNGWNVYMLPLFYLGIPLFFLNFDLNKLKDYTPIIFFLSLYIPLQFIIANKETRFIMPVLPFMVLMAAEGLRKLRISEVFENKKLSKSVFAFIFLTSIILLPSAMPERNVFAQGLNKEWQAPVMDAGEWLRNNTNEEAVVYANYQYPALGYYSKREIVWFREYEPLEKIIGEEVNRSGYVYYSESSSYPHPSLEELETDSRFKLNKTFENTVYLFYFTGSS